MELDLSKEVTYRVKIGTKTYALREPTVKDVKRFTDKQKDDPENSTLFIGFLEDLGMPREVSENLGISKLKKLSEVFAGDYAGKK